MFIRNKKIISRVAKKREHGYILFLAVLISSIVLAIGLGILSITRKGLELSATGRDSQLAFYAADGSMECVLYWDLAHDGFPTTVFPTSTRTKNTPTSGVICNEQDIADSWIVTKIDEKSAETTFNLTLSNGTCAVVRVRKDVPPGTNKANTTIDARGRNTCDTNFPRRVERGLQAIY